MTAPNILIKSYSRDRISDESGVQKSVVVFQSDQNLIDWVARADGQGYGQGDLVGKAITSPIPQTWDEIDNKNLSWDEIDSLSLTWDELDDRTILKANTDGTFDVDFTELKWGDKSYRINVYGKNVKGEWTDYVE